MVAHLSLQRREFAGEVPHHMLIMVVISEVHVVLVYLILHVTVSVHLNKDLDHIKVSFTNSNLEGRFSILHGETKENSRGRSSVRCEGRCEVVTYEQVFGQTDSTH